MKGRGQAPRQDQGQLLGRGASRPCTRAASPLSRPQSTSSSTSGRLAWLPETARENLARAGARPVGLAPAPSLCASGEASGPCRPQRLRHAGQVRAGLGAGLLIFEPLCEPQERPPTPVTLPCHRACRVQGTREAPNPFLPSSAPVRPGLNRLSEVTQGGRC